MAKRFTDTELWDKEWFMKLSPKLKCLVKLVRDKQIWPEYGLLIGCLLIHTLAKKLAKKNY